MDEQVQARLARLFDVRELVLLGRDTSRIPRRYFDPEAGTFRESLPTM